MAQRYRFDRIEVRPSERALLIDGVPAELGSRAFDLLLALIKHGDRVVTKDELLEMVWPGLVVEENNLAAQVSTLRRLLGPKAIATIPARGYQFSLEEIATSDAPAAAMPPVAAPKADNSPNHSPRSHRQQVLAKAAPSTLTNAERAAVLGGTPHADAANASPLSVAVLPFANLTGDANDEYFSDGLADQLLNVLAKINGLRVIARTSSFSFKGKNVDIATIGARLGVAHVVEGSVKKSGNRLRISVQLVKVADSSPLWSEIYDRTLDDIFAVQDDIAQFVLAELRARLMHQSPGKIELRGVETEVAAAAKGRSGNSEAHRLYLQARFLMNRHGSDDVLKCIDYLQRALAVDPDCAQGWAALSHALVTAADLGAAPVDECAADALKAVQRALALEPDLVDGQVAMCTYQTMHAWDWRGAVTSAQRALQIAPDDVGALKEAAGSTTRSDGRKKRWAMPSVPSPWTRSTPFAIGTSRRPWGCWVELPKPRRPFARHSNSLPMRQACIFASRFFWTVWGGMKRPWPRRIGSGPTGRASLRLAFCIFAKATWPKQTAHSTRSSNGVARVPVFRSR